MEDEALNSFLVFVLEDSRVVQVSITLIWKWDFLFIVRNTRVFIREIAHPQTIFEVWRDFLIECMFETISLFHVNSVFLFFILVADCRQDFCIKSVRCWLFLIGRVTVGSWEYLLRIASSYSSDICLEMCTLGIQFVSYAIAWCVQVIWAIKLLSSFINYASSLFTYLQLTTRNKTRKLPNWWTSLT